MLNGQNQRMKRIMAKVNSGYLFSKMNKVLESQVKLDTVFEYLRYDYPNWDMAGINIYKYNPQGKNTQYSIMFNLPGFKAIEVYRERYTYQTEGLIDSIYFEGYNEEIENLEIFGKLKYVYNEDKTIDKILLDTLDSSTGNFVSLYMDCQYDTSGKLSSRLGYKVDNSGDILEDRTDFKYTNSGDIETIKIYERMPDSENLALIMETGYSYNTPGQLSQTLVSNYLSENEVVQSKFTYSTDGDNVLSEVEWFMLEGMWTELFKTNFIYDKSAGGFIYPVMIDNIALDYAVSLGKIDTIERFRFDGLGWMPSEEMKTFSYSKLVSTREKTLKELDVCVFPNPAASSITVAFDGTDYALCSIFDMSGKLILTKQINTNETVDIKSLQPGYYTVILSVDGVQVGAQKLMKN